MGEHYPLKQFEKSGQGTTERVVGAVVGTAATAIPLGRANRTLVRSDIAEQAPPSEQPPAKVKLDEWARQIWEDSQRPELQPAPGAGPWGYIQQQAGQMLPFAAAMFGSAALGGGPVAPFALNMMVDRENSYRTARAAGASEQQAQTEGLLVGTISGVLGTLQVGKWLKVGTGLGGKAAVKKLTDEAARSAWRELANKGGQIAAQDLNAAVSTGIATALQQAARSGAATIHGDRFDLQDIKEIGEQGLLGVGMGAVMGGAGAVRNVAKAPRVGPTIKGAESMRAGKAGNEPRKAPGVPQAEKEGGKAPTGQGPQVSGVALMLDDGTIIKGPSKNSHVEIIDQLPPERNVVDAGFLDEAGNYLRRDDVLSTPEAIAQRPTSKAIVAKETPEAQAQTAAKEQPTPGEARVVPPTQEETQPPALTNLSQETQTPIAPPTGDYGRAVTFIADTILDARKLGPDVRAQQRQARSQRAGAAAGTLQSARQAGAGGQEALQRSMGQLAGAQAQYENLYAGVRDRLTPEHLDMIYSKIADDPRVRYYEKLDLMRSFDNLVDGRAVTLRQAAIIEKYFGKEMGAAAKTHVPFGERMWNVVNEVANIPRTTMASYDMSGILRQGRVLGGEHPVLYAKMVKRYGQTFYSEAGAKRIEAEYTQSPRFNEAQDAGLDLTEWGNRLTEAGQREERFMAARLMEWLPGVKQSERSFTVALNWLRFGVYDKVVSQAEAVGKPLSAKQKQDLASDINDMSGRSEIKSEAVKRVAPLLNAVFFSPRFARSRFRVLENVPVGAARSIKAGHLDPAFKESVAGLASLVATNLAIMGLLKMTDDEGKVQISPDLRSADGGKIRIGNQRIDPWAGMLQPARFMVRMVTGQTVDASGQVRNLPRRDIAMQFLQSKESPIASLVHAALTGETFLGEPLGAPPSGKTGEALTAAHIPQTIQGVGREIYNRLAPMVIQDATDALIVEGVPQAVTAFGLGFFGAGVQTYETSPYQKSRVVKNEWAKDKYGKAWDDLSMSQQITLRNETSAIDESERLAKAAREPGDNPYATPTENEATRRIFKALPPEVRKELQTAGVGIGISRTIGKDFKLNDERYRRYEEIVTAALQQELPALMQTPSWKNMPQASRDRVLNSTVMRIKKRSRAQVLAEIERESKVARAK